MAQTYTKNKIDELLAQASSSIDTALQNSSDALNEAQSAALDVSVLNGTVSNLSDDVTDLISKTRTLEYQLTQQEATGILSSTYSSPVEIAINQSLQGYDKVVLVANDFSMEFRFAGIYGPYPVFEARVNGCILYEPPTQNDVSDAEFALYSVGSRVFVTSVQTTRRYYGITISGISINGATYSLRAIVDAYGVDTALEGAGTDMDALESNFQQLAQGNPTLFAQLLGKLCLNGFEMGRPCYLMSSVDASVSSCASISDTAIGFGGGAGVSISLASSDIPAEFGNASLLHSTQWLSNFGVLYD